MQDLERVVVALIERHLADHAQSDEFRQVVDAAGQTDWHTFVAPWHLSSHTLAALVQGTSVLPNAVTQWRGERRQPCSETQDGFRS